MRRPLALRCGDLRSCPNRIVQCIMIQSGMVQCGMLGPSKNLVCFSLRYSGHVSLKRVKKTSKSCVSTTALLSMS